MNSMILVSPNLNIRREKILELISKIGLFKVHPDVVYFEDGEKLGVDEAKKIRKHLGLKPFSAKGRVVVLESAGKLTADAQNSLLKLLEEPPEESLIILGVEEESQLIPTILSRCEIVILGSETAPESKEDPGQARMTMDDMQKLHEMTIEERFEVVEKTEDKGELLKDLTLYFRDKIILGDEYLFFAKELMNAEEWENQNVGVRAILEYLMLIMPGSDKIR